MQGTVLFAIFGSIFLNVIIRMKKKVSLVLLSHLDNIRLKVNLMEMRRNTCIQKNYNNNRVQHAQFFLTDAINMSHCQQHP